MTTKMKPTTTAPEVTSSSSTQIAGLAGVLGVALFLVLGFMIFDGPALGDPAEDIRTFFTDNETEIALFTWGMPLAFGVFFLLFASGLRGFLAPGDADTGGMWVRYSYTGAVVQAAVGMVGLTFWGVLGQEKILVDASDDTLRALSGLDTMLFFQVMNWPGAIFLVGASVVIIRSGLMPQWLGFLGCTIAAAGALSGLWIFSGDPGGALGDGLGTISFLGTQIWVLVTAVLMMRSGRTARA